MPDFDLDNLKKTWQEQEVRPKYDGAQIEAMLNKSSRNYVKYILWISIAEFFVILGLNIYYIFWGEDPGSFLNILRKLGIANTNALRDYYTHFYVILKVVSILITGVFVVVFWQNYRRIKVELNLKNLILQIIRFKRTVHLFIFTNILLLLLFTTVLGFFTFHVLSEQHIQLDHAKLIGFIGGIVVMTALSIFLIWIYYRIAYGIILKRLERNLSELQKIENQDV